MEQKPTAEQILAAAVHAEKDGDIDNATNAYNYVLQVFPGSQAATFAQERLNNILLSSLPQQQPVTTRPESNEQHYHQTVTENNQVTPLFTDQRHFPKEQANTIKSVSLQSQEAPSIGQDVKRQKYWGGLPFALVSGFITTVVGGLMLYFLQDVIFGVDPRITGRVLYLDGQPVKEARVEITKQANSTVTAKDGTFELAYVPGSFELKITKDGFYSHQAKLDLNERTKYELKDTYLYQSSKKGLVQIVNGSKLSALPTIKLTYYSYDFQKQSKSKWGDFAVVGSGEPTYKLTQLPKLLPGPVTFIVRDWRNYSLLKLTTTKDIFKPEASQPVWSGKSSGQMKTILVLAAGKARYSGTPWTGTRLDLSVSPGDNGNFVDVVDTQTSVFPESRYSVVRSNLSPGLYAITKNEASKEEFSFRNSVAYVFSVGGQDQNPLKEIAKHASSLDETSWKDAVQLNTVSALENYISRFPKGLHLAEAKKRSHDKKFVRSLAKGASISQVLLSPDRKKFFIVRRDKNNNNSLEVWDLNGKQTFSAPVANNFYVNHFIGSSDPRIGISRQQSTNWFYKTVSLWDLNSGTQIATTKKTGRRDCKEGAEVAALSNGGFLLPCKEAIQIWSVNPLKPIATTKLKVKETYTQFIKVSVASNGQVMAAASKYQLWMWDVASGQILFNSRGNSDGWGRYFEFTPNSKFLVFRDKKNLFKIPTKASGKYQKFKLPSNNRNQLIGLSNTHFALIGKNLEIYGLSDAKLLRFFRLDKPVASVVFPAVDGNTFFSAGGDGKITEWRLD